MSPSSTPMRAPLFDNATARLTATVVLPTPPLPAPTAITFLTPGSGGLPCSGADTDLTTKRVSTSTPATPGSVNTAVFARSASIARLAGDGFADSIANATRSPAIVTSLTYLSVTMSTCRSGSATAFSAARTASGAIRNSAYHAREIGKLPQPEGDLDGRCDAWKCAVEQPQRDDRVVVPVAVGAGTAAHRERRQGSAVARQARDRADGRGALHLDRDQRRARRAGHLRLHRAAVRAAAAAGPGRPARDVHRQGHQRPAPDHSGPQRLRQQAVRRRGGDEETFRGSDRDPVDRDRARFAAAAAGSTRHAGGGRRHPHLSSDVIPVVRAHGRAVPLYGHLQSLRRSGDQDIRRRQRRVDGGEEDFT